MGIREGRVANTSGPGTVRCALIGVSVHGARGRQHLTVPDPEVFAAMPLRIPNYSTWMSAISATVTRPQILTLDERHEKYNRRYAFVTEKLVEQRGNFLSIPDNTPGMTPVHNSLQFNLLHDLTNKQMIKFLEEATAHGLSPSSSSATCPMPEVLSTGDSCP